MKALEIKPLSERIYRLKLLQGFTILTRDEAGKDGDRTPDERSLIVQDLILLSRDLPYPATQQDLAQIPQSIEALIGKCQSQWSKELDQDMALVVAWGSYAASKQPGAFILDGLMPLV